MSLLDEEGLLVRVWQAGTPVLEGLQGKGAERGRLLLKVVAVSPTPLLKDPPRPRVWGCLPALRYS